MTRWGILLPAAVVLGFLVLMPENALAQCPMCRTALESTEGREMAKAFNRAILLLLGVPFAAVGTITLLIVRGWRRHTAAASALSASDT